MALDRGSLIPINFGSAAQGGKATCFPWKFNPWWTDPDGPGLGTAAQWLKYDVNGAKALLAQAGFANGFAMPLHYTSERYGPDYASGAQAIGSMLDKVGIRVQLDDQPSNVFITSTFVVQFDGLGWSLETPYYDPDDYLFNLFHPKGARNHSAINDSQINALIDRERVENNPEKRLEITREAEKYAVDQMLYLWGLNSVMLLALQPNVKGFGVGVYDYNNTFATVWLS